MSDMWERGRALERVSVLCDLHRYEEAAAAVTILLAGQPDIPRAHCLLARARLGLDDDAGAFEASRRAIGLDPESEWPHRLASIALDKLGRHAEALAFATKAASLEPLNWRAHLQLARASLRASRREQAKTAAARAIELGPAEPEAWIALAEVEMAFADWDSARDALGRALAIESNNAVAHAQLARLELRGRLGATDSAGLARAASGFATSLGVDPRLSASRRNLDLVLRVFLARTTDFLFFACIVLAWVSFVARVIAARLLPAAVLLASCVVVAYLLARLDRRVRAHLFWSIRHGQLAVAVGSDVLAAVCLAFAPFVPLHARAVVVMIGLAAAIVGRLTMINAVVRIQARRSGPAENAGGARSPKPRP